MQQRIKDVELPQLCLPRQDFNAAQLIAVTADTLSRADELRAHIARVRSRQRAQLARAFDEIVALLGHRGARDRNCPDFDAVVPRLRAGLRP